MTFDMKTYIDTLDKYDYLAVTAVVIGIFFLLFGIYLLIF